MKKFDAKKFIFLGLILGLIFSAVTYQKFSNDIDEIVEEQEIRSNELVENSIDRILFDTKELLYNRLVVLLSKKTILEAFESKNREELYTLTLPTLASLIDVYDVKSMHFILENNDSFLRTHKPHVADNNVASYKPLIVKVNNTKKVLSGFEAGKQGYYYRIIYPIFYKEKYLGLVEIGLSSSSILNNIKEHINSDLAIFVNKKAIKDKYIKETKHFFNNYALCDNTDEQLSLKLINNEDFELEDEEEIFKVDKKLYELDVVELNDLNGESFLVIIHDVTKSYINIQKTKESFLLYFIIILIVFVLISYYIYYILDKTIKEQYKELILKKNEAVKLVQVKSEFLANMSHEIRTPLNAILGFIDILTDESQGRKILKYVDIIKDSGKSLLQIIEDILDFSKIENGKLIIDKINFDIRAEIEAITNLFEGKSSQKNITLELILDDNLPHILNSDSLRIRQILSNLLGNAIKFTERNKKITVTVSYKLDKLYISILDEGIGIDKEKQKYIFTPFTQEDSSTTRKFGGTGLGLSISSELVKLLGGELKVNSELGKGSEFYFSIPVSIGTVEELEVFDDIEVSFENKKLLLVEDNKSNQLFMKIILKKLKIDFQIASNGLEAVEMFTKNKYDFILMDENMPVMSGIEATQNIIAIEKEKYYSHTPIIALTANALKGDRARFLASGMDEYLTKPLNEKKLKKVLAVFL